MGCASDDSHSSCDKRPNASSCALSKHAVWALALAAASLDSELFDPDFNATARGNALYEAFLQTTFSGAVVKLKTREVRDPSRHTAATRVARCRSLLWCEGTTLQTHIKDWSMVTLNLIM